MIKIGVVENEPMHTGQLLNLLQQWEKQNNLPLEIECFSSGEELLSRNSIDYHVIFLDIQLPGRNGMETARALRERKYQNELIFLTAYNNYILDGYEVHALNYIIKPAVYEKLDSCMQYLKDLLHEPYFIYQNKTTSFRIPYDQILYLSTFNHCTNIITTENTYQQIEPLKNIIRQLPPQFVQCHRAMVVNIQHVRTLRGRTITLSNRMELSVSRTYQKLVEQKFMQRITLRK